MWTGCPNRASSSVRSVCAGVDENVVSIRVEPDIEGAMGHTAGAEEQRRFACLYEAHRLHVLAYCVRRTSRADAADACSETFLAAWRSLDELPEEPDTLP